MPNGIVDLGSEVAGALRAGRPIVALESTLIAHGMPWPQNIETALAMEADVRTLGAVPATIAIVDGRLKAGLAQDEIERLARVGRDIAKASRRDLPILVARRATGATTVAATMIIAALAGIRVFATGGIGGVHRGAETTFDISADLQELARTSVAVVCAGAKSVLDLRLTLEYLETHGVPVIGYRTDRFPAFYTRDSGLGVDARIDEPDEVARVMRTKWDLGLAGGLVIANPIPETFELPRKRIDAATEQALDEARGKRIAGKALTPFLLERVNALTEGKSLISNVELVRNNARLAACVAVAYAALAAQDRR
ncbi:MAG TPA: pseudouridine-5'-phosphate glycosidase [Casimicrobiaceae bacterium]|nr:pseudouridine-5'-phosphate glycosidase [Casimicrobiaceae bacterium]